MGNHSIAHNVVSKGILSVFNMLLPLIIAPYVYRILGPNAMGNIEYAMALFGYFSMLGLFGIYNYGLREISANRNDIGKIRNIYENLFVIGVISNILILSLYIAFIHFCIKDPSVRLISWILCGHFISQIFNVEWFNEAMEEFQFITIKTVVIRLLSLVAIFCVVKSPSDIYKYVCITVAVAIVNYVVSFIYSKRKICLSILKGWRELHLKNYIVPLLMVLVLNNTGILYTVVDRTFLGYFVGAESVAYFSIGQKMVEVTKGLLLSVVFATLPRLSFYLKSDKPLYQAGILKVMQAVLLLIIPSGVGMLLLSNQIIWLLGGAAYELAVPAMRIFSLRIILLGIESVLYNQIIFLHGKEKTLVKYNLICGGINIGLNCMALKILSPFISIACTLISEIVFMVLCIRYIRRRLHIEIGVFTKQNLRYVLLSLCFVPIILGIRYFLDSQIAIVVLSVLACAVLYVCALRKLKDEVLLMMFAKFVALVKRK